MQLFSQNYDLLRNISHNCSFIFHYIFENFFSHNCNISNKCDSYNVTIYSKLYKYCLKIFFTFEEFPKEGFVWQN